MTRDITTRKGRQWSRRKLLQASAVVGGGIIAGCSTQDGEGTPMDTETPGEGTPVPTGTPTSAPEDCEPIDDRFDFIEFSHPNEVNVAVNAAREDYTTFTLLSSIINKWIGGPSPIGEDFSLPLLYDEYGLTEDRTTWHMHMVEDHAGWHDGTPLHINDVRYPNEFQWKYDQLTGTEVDIVEFEVVDDYTLNAELTKPQHPGLFLTRQQYPAPSHPAHEMESWWERMMDATTESEAEAIMTEFQELSVPLGDNPEEHVGNGRFMIDQVTDSYVDLVAWEDFKYYDESHAQVMRCHFFGGDGPMRLAWQNGIPDFGYPPSGDINFPDKYEVPDYPSMEGGGVEFNQNNEHLAKRDFRRALLYMWDMEAACRVTDATPYPVDYWIGVPPITREQWFSDWDSYKENLIDYGSRANLEKATELLEGLGYSKEGDQWVDSDGETIAFNFKIAETWPPDYPVQAMSDQMQAFGFDMTYEVFAEDEWGGHEFFEPEYVDPENEGNWDLVLMNRGPDFINFPANCFGDSTYYFGIPLTPPGMTRENREYTFAGREEVVTIPSEVGAMEVEGDGMEIDINAYHEELESPDLTDERMVEITETLSWYQNYSAQCVYVNFDTNSFTYNAQEWSVADLDGNGFPDNYYSNRLERGHIKPKCE